MTIFMCPMWKDALYCKWSDLNYQGQIMIKDAVLTDQQFMCYLKCEQ